MSDYGRRGGGRRGGRDEEDDDEDYEYERRHRGDGGRGGGGSRDRERGGGRDRGGGSGQDKLQRLDSIQDPGKRYVLRDRIGSGVCGDVYEGVDEEASKSLFFSSYPSTYAFLIQKNNNNFGALYNAIM